MSRSATTRASRQTVEVRLAGTEDATAVSEVLFEAFSMYRDGYTPEAFAQVTPDPAEVTRRFEEGPVWVATLGGVVVGTVSVNPEPEWLYIRSMAVRPTALQLGIASKLMAWLPSRITHGINASRSCSCTRPIFRQVPSSFTRKMGSGEAAIRPPKSGSARRA